MNIIGLSTKYTSKEDLKVVMMIFKMVWSKNLYVLQDDGECELLESFEEIWEKRYELFNTDFERIDDVPKKIYTLKDVLIMLKDM